MAESALSLVERLRAALDRAEEIARAASGGLWEHQQHGIESEVWSYVGHRVLLHAPTHLGTGGFNSFGAPDCRFVAANGPESVLRTVAAHRKIIEEFEGAAEWADTLRSEGDHAAAELYARHAGTLLEVLRILAAVYFPEAPDA